jgi:TRAP-type mannitol/chloroaromatic compound transport system substrate-binding protein
MRTMRKLGIVGAVCIAVVFAWALGGETPGRRAEATSHDVVKWKMQSFTVPGGALHDVLLKGAERMRKKTGGRMNLEVFPVGAIVGLRETVEATGKGIIQVGYDVPSFNAGLDPAFAAWFSLPGVWPLEPAGMANWHKRTWVDEGGGKELGRELYARFNVHLVDTVIGSAEPLHSKRPIKSLADLKGLKVRAGGGLVNEIFIKAGASPVALPGSEIYTALDTGVVGAAEWVGLVDNYAMGLHQVAKYVLYPGFHSPEAMSSIFVNMDAWKALPEDLKIAMEDFVMYVNAKNATYFAYRDTAIIERMKKEHRVTQTRLSPQDMRKLTEWGQEIAREWAKKSPMSGKIVESTLTYLKLQGLTE